MEQNAEPGVKASSGDVKGKLTRTRGKNVFVTPPAVRVEEDSSFELMDPAHELYDPSTIEVAMGLGAILFTGAADETSRDYGQESILQDHKAPVGDERILRNLLGNMEEPPILRDHVGVPNLSDLKNRQAVSVVPADYWMLNC